VFDCWRYSVRRFFFSVTVTSGYILSGYILSGYILSGYILFGCKKPGFSRYLGITQQAYVNLS
jgi:hypothetical protein